MAAFFLFSACKPAHRDEVDKLNALSYSLHYRDLSATKTYAERALSLSADYDAGYAEACNNLAFVSIAKMNYKEAQSWLSLIDQKTDNEIELLIADVQNMHICQRSSRNKDFYTYRERAMRRLRRIGEEADNLPPHERKRAVYARSEFDIVSATYFYNVSMESEMQTAMNDISPEELELDTAQYLRYLYTCGYTHVIQKATEREVTQAEFDCLAQCYMLAGGTNPYPYWQACALKALSDHLLQPEHQAFLIKNNQPAIHYLNEERLPDSLLAGNLAMRSLHLFADYGDVYQTANAYRMLGECFWRIGDYASTEDCLLHALKDNQHIASAPYTIAAIREQLSLLYSAQDDKQRSDFNRNIYLDLQEQARQDRQLEARASQLDTNATQLNAMIFAVVATIVLILVLLFFLDRMRKHKSSRNPVSNLLRPLQEWQEISRKHLTEMEDRQEEIMEQYQINQLHVAENKQRNLEQRAKVSLMNSITPFIDRMKNEVSRLQDTTESQDVRSERLQYISELTDTINQYNEVLTQWIQMRQGSLSLKIESFALQQLFEILAKGKMAFQMKGISLVVNPTTAVVKADRTLTLFMINTIADNARKFTPAGGTITVEAREESDCVEVSVTDTGRGMTADQLAHIFDHTYTGGHGFGLLNCKGIIEKYKKISSLFAVCDIKATSQEGHGSRFAFRLPKGIVRIAILILMAASILCPKVAKAAAEDTLSATVQQESMHHKHTAQETLSSKYLVMADRYADSVYFCNINAQYQRALLFADSARHCLNQHYLALRPGGTDLMEQSPSKMPAAEIKWYYDGLQTNYNIILDIRNESAVAALALHHWTLYQANNDVYTRLFRDLSTDSTLPDYVRAMQSAENSKIVAIIILILLLLLLFPAYYLVYFRHVLTYRFAVEKINDINRLLLSAVSDKEKLERVREIWNSQERLRGLNPQLDAVVRQIEEALQQSVDLSANKAVDIEMMEDQLRRSAYENAQLHVANSVLDNCLSTLKHETMYYPSRIRQLIDTHPEDISSLHELVDYYQSLYTILSAQAMQQVEASLKVDAGLATTLFDILKRQGGEMPREGHMSENGKYIRYEVQMTRLQLSEADCANLFTPLTSDLQFLLCRQIVRDMGEATNLRGCGIRARKQSDGSIVVEVTMPAVFKQ